MAIRQIREIGDEILTKQCKEVKKMSLSDKDPDRGYAGDHV